MNEKTCCFFGGSDSSSRRERLFRTGDGCACAGTFAYSRAAHINPGAVRHTDAGTDPAAGRAFHARG